MGLHQVLRQHPKLQFLPKYHRHQTLIHQRLSRSLLWKLHLLGPWVLCLSRSNTVYKCQNRESLRTRNRGKLRPQHLRLLYVGTSPSTYIRRLISLLSLTYSRPPTACYTSITPVLIWPRRGECTE